MKLEKLSMQFATHETGSSRSVLEAYERLIHDAMRGDHTLFTTADGIETLWDSRAPAALGPAAGARLRARQLGPQRDPPADRAARLAAAVRAVLAPAQHVRRVGLTPGA